MALANQAVNASGPRSQTLPGKTQRQCIWVTVPFNKKASGTKKHRLESDVRRLFV